MDVFNTTEFDEAINESEKALFTILENEIPATIKKDKRPGKLLEFIDILKIHFEEKTVMSDEDLSEDAEKILEKFKGKPNYRTCKMMLRDPIFERIIGKMMESGMPADSLIGLVTDISLEVKIDTLRTSRKFLEIVRNQAKARFNFEQAIKWLMDKAGEEGDLADEARQEFLIDELKDHVGDVGILKELAHKECLCDVMEAMEAENLQAYFLVDILSEYMGETSIGDFETPASANTGVGIVSTRLNEKFEDAGGSQNREMATSTVKPEEKKDTKTRVSPWRTGDPLHGGNEPSWCQAGTTGQGRPSDPLVGRLALMNATRMANQTTPAKMDPLSRILSAATIDDSGQGPQQKSANPPAMQAWLGALSKQQLEALQGIIGGMIGNSTGIGPSSCRGTPAVSSPTTINPRGASTTTRNIANTTWLQNGLGTSNLSMNSTFANMRGMNVSEIMNTVPKFSGDSNSVREFASRCRQAASQFPLESPGVEQHFVKLAKLRLSGDALQAIEGREFGRLEEFLAYLGKLFGKNGTFCEAVGALSNMKQGPQESVVTFSNRIRDAGITMAEAAIQEGRSVTSQSIKDDMVEYFWRGLRDRIKIRVETKPRDLDEAVIEARRVEQRIGKETEDEKEDRILMTTETPVANPDLMARLESLLNAKPTCQICGKRGHLAKECWQLIGPPNRRPSGPVRPQRQQMGSGTEQIGQPQAYDPARDSRRCFGCGQIGHIRYNCPDRQHQGQNQRLQQERGQGDAPARHPPLNMRQEQVALTEITQRDLQQFLDQHQRDQGATSAWSDQKNERWGQA